MGRSRQAAVGKGFWVPLDAASCGQLLLGCLHGAGRGLEEGWRLRNESLSSAGETALERR